MKYTNLLILGTSLTLGAALAQDPVRTSVIHGPASAERAANPFVWDSIPLEQATDRGVPIYVPTTRRPLGAEPEVSIDLGSAMEANHSRLHWDKLGDGQIWVRGEGYKASFGANGMKFIPFLGSEVPRNFPVSMQLESISMGSKNVPLAKGQMGDRDGEQVVLDRGPVLVQYDVELDSIEQSFHFGEVTTDGPIVITLALNTDLEPVREGNAWRFAGEHGGVDYGKAIAYDEAGKVVSLDVDVTAEQVRITVPASFVQSAVGALVVDPTLSTFDIDNSSGLILTNPDVAYSYTNDHYCVVYEEVFSGGDSDVYSRYIDGLTGAFSNGLYIDSTDEDWIDPSVAYQLNSDVFLTVAAATEVAGTTRHIRGRIRNAADSTTMAPFYVYFSDLGVEALHPDVGGDTFASTDSYFMVVWEVNQFSANNYIVCQAIEADGSPHAPANVIDSVVPGTSVEPVVSESTGMNGSTFYVAFRSDDGSTSYVDVRRVNYNGALIGSTFNIDATPGIHDGIDISEPVAKIHVGTGQRYYIVTYDNNPGVGADIEISLCAGSTLLSQSILHETEHDELILDNDGPTVATTSSSWVVAYARNLTGSVWETHCVAFQPVGDNIGVSELPFAPGSLIRNTGDHQGFGFASTVSGGAPANFRDMLIAAEEDVTPDRYIRGARLFAQGTDPVAGYQYCYGEQNSTGERALIYAWGDNSTTAIKELKTARMPLNQFCYLLAGSDAGYVPNPAGSDGDLCVGGLLGRYNLGSEIGFTGATGTFDFNVDPTAIRQVGGSTVGMVGQTWYFQTWFRDSPAGTGHSNFSNGVAIPLF